MREYSKIAPSFWTGSTGRRLRALSQERGNANLWVVAQYLLTSPHATMLGLYYLPVAYISHDIGIPFEGALESLRTLSEEGFCHFDEASEWVYIPEMARWQVGDVLDVKDNRVKGINREYQALPKNPFLRMFFDRYGQVFHLDSSRENGGAPEGLHRGSRTPPKPGAGAGAGDRTGTGKETPPPTPQRMTMREVDELYTTTFGRLQPTGGEREILGRIIADHTPEAIREAFFTTQSNRKDHLSYVTGCLKRRGNAGTDYDEEALIREMEEMEK